MSFCSSAILLTLLSTPPELEHPWHGDAGRAEATWMRVPGCFHADGHNLATDGTNDVGRHPAPEVDLWFSGGCNAAEFTNWKLSSHDAPRSWTVIPLGAIRVEVNTDIAPVDFVELLLDGKPLAPKDYLNSSPLNYELPCPAPGQHVLQARYLHNHRWSHFSPALRIEVRLPKAPRILAISDSHQDPIVPTRNGMASITTGDVKIRLANVDQMTQVVAYVDGKPVVASQAEDSCCRILRVEGLVTPGVHKLTARAVACPGSCSITSPPSNEVMFHYYDEDVYLLRPNAGCGNRRHDATFHVLPSAPNAAEAPPATHHDFVPQGHKSVLGHGARTPKMTEFRTATFLAEPIGDTSITKLIAFTQAPETPEQNVDAEAAEMKAIAEHAVRLLQPAEQAVSQAQESAKAATNSVQTADKPGSSACPDCGRTKNNADEMEKLRGNAKSILAEAQALLIKANSEVDRATEYASRKEMGGNTARAIVAMRRAENAARNRDAIQQQVTELNTLASRLTDAAQRTTEGQLAQSRVVAERMSQTITELRTKAITAEDDRRIAGRTLEKEAEAERHWNASEEDAALAAATAKSDAAKAGKDENGVRRAQENARAAQTIAADEWKAADSRMAEAEAKTSFARAQQVTNPPSPFFFASAAHFPLRDFGLKGQPIDREGLIIYEDMEFRFDRHGNYEVHFRATTPELPTILRLQFQIQSHRGGPWYTITLAPIQFPYQAANTTTRLPCATGDCDKSNERQCCGEVRECVCKGKSEILRRCYGEMGQDAKIRRSGTARFGYGVGTDTP